MGKIGFAPGQGKNNFYFSFSSFYALKQNKGIHFVSGESFKNFKFTKIWADFRVTGKICSSLDSDQFFSLFENHSTLLYVENLIIENRHLLLYIRISCLLLLDCYKLAAMYQN